MKRVQHLGLAATAAIFVIFGMNWRTPPVHAEEPTIVAANRKPVVGMRRLTEEQYRNSIADIFGPDIQRVGRFEPIVRTGDQLIAAAAASTTVSPAGIEQFDVMARGIATQVFDRKHRAVFMRCKPRNDREPDRACSEKTLNHLGRFVLRRPLTRGERKTYTGMAATAAARTASFYDGMALALGAMLTSPEFLFVFETAEADPAKTGEMRLDNYSRAARLSYLLWNSTPDASLLDAAERGELTNPTKLTRVAERMVASPRLAGGVRAFFADMLKFEKFEQMAKDPMVYPRFNPEVARSLPEQMALTIVDHLITRSGDYRKLFTTPHTFLNRSLGPLYYAPVRSRSGWEPYTFSDGDDRAGLLGQAGFLALYSHSGRSSPTLRGRAIRELLLCQPVPNPPGNVDFTVVQETNNPVFKTARARLSAHADNPSCSGCHKITDPIGLPLELFDGIGAFRTTENGEPLDLSGAIGTATFRGARGLGHALATDPSLTTCAVSRTLEYAMGRSVESMDETVLDLERTFAESGYRFPVLMLAIATSPNAYRVESGVLPAPSALARAGSDANRGAKQ